MKTLLIIALSVLISASGDDRGDRLLANNQNAQYMLGHLGSSLDKGQIRNANLLREYGKLLVVNKIKHNHA